MNLNEMIFRQVKREMQFKENVIKQLHRAGYHVEDMEFIIAPHIGPAENIFWRGQLLGSFVHVEGATEWHPVNDLPDAN